MLDASRPLSSLEEFHSWQVYESLDAHRRDQWHAEVRWLGHRAAQTVTEDRCKVSLQRQLQGRPIVGVRGSVLRIIRAEALRNDLFL